MWARLQHGLLVLAVGFALAWLARPAAAVPVSGMYPVRDSASRCSSGVTA